MQLSVWCTGPLWEPRGFIGDETRSVPSVTSLSKLFIHHPYSQSSKASNPRLPRWSTDREPRQPGRQVASLFMRCLTRRAWRGISHVQNYPKKMVSAWGCGTFGYSCEWKSGFVQWCAEMHKGGIMLQSGFPIGLCRCCETGLRARSGTALHILTLHPQLVHIFHIPVREETFDSTSFSRSIMFTNSPSL